MIVFFEGPDKSGKTTIAKALIKELNFYYFKDSRQREMFYKIGRVSNNDV